jgi:hypothetical protein
MVSFEERTEIRLNDHAERLRVLETGAAKQGGDDRTTM